MLLPRDCRVTITYYSTSKEDIIIKGLDIAEASSPKKPKQKAKLSAAVSRSLREGTLWVLGALALLLLLALMSYHPHDPGFSDTGEPGSVGNWIGPGGAWVLRFFFDLE